MALLGNIVIYLMMAFVLIGAFSLAFRGDRGIGHEFKEGIYALGPLFVPIAGIMAALPYLSWFVEHVLGKVYEPFGADAAMAATTLIASDMGAYQLAEVTADSTGAWMTASVNGFLLGATISFIIPVGLAILDVRDHKYFALGIMSGILTVPLGVVVTMGILILTDSTVRDSAVTDGPSTATLDGFGFGDVLINLLPVFLVTIAIAAGLYFATRAMITGFIWFGKGLNAAILVVLALSIVEHVTGFFSARMGAWGLDPIIADADDQMRSLEVAGNIAIVLAGAFPLVYAIRTYLDKPLTAVGTRAGISTEGTAGLLAATTNMLAAFHLIKHMPAKDKVLVVAFGTTCSALIGDHLAFTANFQPNLIAPLMIGKIVAGVTAMLLALWIAVPTATRIERERAELDSVDPSSEDDDRVDPVAPNHA
ncbi:MULTISPECIES: ethanolamine utilization protein EutH [Mycobacteriaceae]|jgi:ethanolamine transporter|uniref:Ethanolamine utilization protein EutH n=1 Tax=Mycolicibacterium vaccae ATCC 25954 TaxID=1194972 RepID=K0UU49_MYCVA|nr:MULTISPECIES: ethanolamine utilization protein EutH [Mycobacteriaceae]ANI42885.1 ethanolamine utilization protein EutH [Mycolicibacterium vaccae 95051]EJZ08490.1 ethanolamine utilization protein EutH [Mycolicibacterium vaccae ATCC 25954]WNG87631.1 ethanolamine utilization protein EutH [Mycobacterium sp. ITM-2016-00317]